MRTVVRNSFARETIKSERVFLTDTSLLRCGWCAQVRQTPRGRRWLYAFHVEPDAGRSFDVSDRFFCSRECAEFYINRRFDERKVR